MSQFDFRRYDPKGRTCEYQLPIDGVTEKDPETGEEKYTPATLILKPATEANPSYHNAMLAFNAKNSIARKLMAGSKDADILAMQRDLELYPQSVIVGWKGIPNTQGKAVPFSPKACAEFLAALPRWIFTGVRIHAVQEAHFIAPSVPDAGDQQAQAGN